MSKESVDIVRQVFAEWGSGNFSGALLHPEVRIRWLASITPATWHSSPSASGEQQVETVGPDDATKFLRDFLSAFEGVTLSAEKIVDAGDKVVAIATWRGRGKISGALTEWRHGGVWEVRDAKVVSLISYPDPADALKAAGLSQ
jgi:ketosteroid isomerase-like protein